jgi:uncharacterized membrane protein YcaP (DUF421 family)
MGDVNLLTAVAIRTIIVLVALVAGARYFGPRQLGEMHSHDLLMVPLMANAVQNAMTKGDGHLGVALVSSGMLLLAGWLVGVATSRHPALEP